MTHTKPPRKSYSEKLKDPRWQKKRLEVLSRDGFSCKLCGDKETTLHVHHLKYTKDPWDAPLEDLQALCEHCHGLIEHIKKEMSWMPEYIVKVYKVNWDVKRFYVATAGDILMYQQEPGEAIERCSVIWLSDMEPLAELMKMVRDNATWVDNG